jgi:hypothetical protein
MARGRKEIERRDAEGAEVGKREMRFDDRHFGMRIDPINLTSLRFPLRLGFSAFNFVSEIL